MSGGTLVLRMLDAKRLRNAVKSNWTIADLCEKYHCSDIELVDMIHRIYNSSPRDAEEIVSSLRANEKKPRKKRVTLAPIAEGMIEAGDAVEVDETQEKKPEEVLIQEELSEEISTQEGNLSKDMPTQNTGRNTLEVKRLSASRLTKEILDLEADIKGLKEENKTLHERLKAYYKVLEDMEHKLINLVSDCNKISDRKEEILKETEKLNLVLKGKRRELDTLEGEIKELEKLTIFVYDSGVIEADRKDVLLDDSGSEELYKLLLQREDCGELRLKEIKTLARLLEIVQHLKVNVEVECDNEELKRVYSLITSEM